MNNSSMEELLEMANAVNAELKRRIASEKAESDLSTTSADQFIYVDNGEEAMIRDYSGVKSDIIIHA